MASYVVLFKIWYMIFFSCYNMLHIIVVVIVVIERWSLKRITFPPHQITNLKHRRENYLDHIQKMEKKILTCPSGLPYIHLLSSTFSQWAVSPATHTFLQIQHCPCIFCIVLRVNNNWVQKNSHSGIHDLILNWVFFFKLLLSPLWDNTHYWE